MYMYVVCVYIYIHTHISLYIYIYIYIYIYGATKYPYIPRPYVRGTARAVKSQNLEVLRAMSFIFWSLDVVSINPGILKP